MFRDAIVACLYHITGKRLRTKHTEQETMHRILSG